MKARDVEIAIPRAKLSGTLAIPDHAGNLIVFAHGSGSSRHSARNKYVANLLNDAGFATLLFDLLTPNEESVDRITAHLRFNIEFLADRLIAVISWLAQEAETRNSRIGLFGASTGSAAAVVAASQLPRTIAAVVSRGGRPDLAGEALTKIQSPTLLIVGGNDERVLEMNRWAFERLQCPTDLTVIPGATHLFEEPGALEQVAKLAENWFTQHMAWTDPGQAYVKHA